ncbi:MAG: YceI family protein [Capnocytophaga sp.]|nr:YceI family protein [Capnocytophaga sp.]
MRKILFAVAMAVTTMVSFAQDGTKKINTKKSSLVWTGSKVIGSSHNGTLSFKSGELTFKNNTLVGGNFVIDMNSLSVTDLSGDGKTKLEGHLKSDDFFGVAKFSNANLIIKNATKQQDGSYNVKADLTIKGITKPVEFVFSLDKNSALTAFDIDRSKFDVRYGSGSFFENLGDKAINNDFNIKVELFY